MKRMSEANGEEETPRGKLGRGGKTGRRGAEIKLEYGALWRGQLEPRTEGRIRRRGDNSRREFSSSDGRSAGRARERERRRETRNWEKICVSGNTET